MKRILFICHETSRTGAPMVLLHFLKWLKINQPDILVDVLSLTGGALEDDFKTACHSYYNHHELTKPKSLSFIQRVLLKLRLYKRPNLSEKLTVDLSKKKYDIIYANTIVTIPLASAISNKNESSKFIAHIHELNAMIKLILPNFSNYIGSIDQFIAASNLVKSNLVNNWLVDEKSIDLVYECASVSTKREKPVDLKKEKPFTIGASGTVDWRKGYDVFIQVANYLNINYRALDFKLIWVGAINAQIKIIIEEDLKKLGLHEKVTFVGEQANPHTYYEDFDVFLMTSREDPFPLVCIEVALLGKPIISFDKAVGTNEILYSAGGFIVPYLDIEAMSKKTVKYIKNPSLAVKHGEMNRIAFSQFTPEIICPKLFLTIKRSQNK